MFRLILVSFILLVLGACKPDEKLNHERHFTKNPYQTEFGDDYESAVKFLAQNRLIIDSVLTSYQTDKAFALSIVFPELIRYSFVSDFLETGYLELIYTESGSEYADFSIGNFQMKPSFIELLEKEIITDSVLSEKYKNVVTYTDTTNQRHRKERLARLKTIEYQLVYISAYCEILKERFPDSGKETAFAASAYNFGFQRSESDIQAHIPKKTFPFGHRLGSNNFSYSEISVFFYENIYHTIF